MRWEDERYVRVYTRDTLDWQALSFEAQGLLTLVLRKVDRAGILKLGKHGKRGVAVAVGHGHRWSAVEPALEELLADGCVSIRGEDLLIPNFIKAQEAQASDKARQAAKRERDRDKVAAQGAGHLSDSAKDEISAVERVTDADEAVTPPVTEERHAGAVTLDGHAGGVTLDASPLAVPSRAVPSEPATTSAAQAPRPDGFALEPTKPEPKPRKPSKWKQLRDASVEQRVRWLPDAHDDEPGFLATAKECNERMPEPIRWIQDQDKCDEPAATWRWFQIVWLYLHDDWPGRMTNCPPWSYWVLIKHKQLGDYLQKARTMEWQDDGCGFPEPVKRGGA